MPEVSRDRSNSSQRTVVTPSTSRHRCYLCDRTYERADHLSRHLRSHDNDRSYRCSDCGKGFNRADLLNRHKSAHANVSDGNYRRRTGRACEACIRAKARCDDERPCKRCETRKLLCPDSDDRRSPSHLHRSPQSTSKRVILPEDAQPLLSPVSRSLPLQSNDARCAVTGPNHGNVEDAELLLGMNFMAHTADGVNVPSNERYESSYENAVPADLGGYIDYFDYIMMPDATTTNVNNGAMIPPDVSNFTQDLDLDTFDLDISFLASGLTRPPSAQDKPTDDAIAPLSDQDSGMSDVQRRAEAFKRSPWSWDEWIPSRGAQPFRGQDEEEINIQDDRVNAMDQLTSPGKTRSGSCKMTQEARDRMIKVVTQVSRDRLSMPSFPSLELLEDLVDILLLQDSTSIDSYIHATSLNCADIRTETLLGMVAAGARYIALAPVWKMGLIFQEVTRLATAALYENDNSTTRDLQATQASLLWLEVGTWSGFRRKTEIAASLLQPVITMLVWASRFSNHRYVDIVPSQLDDDDVLEGKWKHWVEQEGFKRIVFHTFLYDSQEAIVHMHSPLISVAQMLLPLPASKELWLAPSAHVWRDLFLQSNPGPQATVPSLVNVLGRTEILNATAAIDKPLCLLSACHAMAHQVWQYRQQTRMLIECHGDDRSARWLAHMSWQRSIYDDLIRMNTFCELHHDAMVEISFTLNFLMMCLHVILEDIQTFSGKSGEDEARKIVPRIRKWTEDAQSRIAVWHAGQVFRLADKLEKTRLRDFYAVTLYHSALTLWVYGMVTSNTTRNQTTVPSMTLQSSSASTMGSVHSVVVNGDDEKSMRAFTLLEHYVPHLRVVGSEDIAISDATGVMAVAESLLRSNFPLSMNGLPPLVESLANLMNELGKLSGK